jgi:hypothetical protein
MGPSKLPSTLPGEIYGSFYGNSNGHCKMTSLTFDLVRSHYPSSAHITCLAIIGWQLERVSHDIWCYMTSHKECLINEWGEPTVSYGLTN